MRKHILSISVLILVDQVSKILARNFFDPPILVLGEFFQLKLAFNTGIAFSLPFPKVWLIILTIVVLSLLAVCAYKKKLSSAEQVVAVLIFSGAFSNLIDRLMLGSVTDFLSFWSFPIFNFADIFITVGVMIFFIVEFGWMKK